jgi:type 1 glutamine amidotransferase
VLLAWADTRNGQAQHAFTSHALAIVERLGYESGLWDTFIRTDSHIIFNQAQKTDGTPASGGPGLSNVDGIFFLGHRDVPITDQQKAELLAFVRGGKGFVAAHTGLTAFESWPEFGEMVGAKYGGHLYTGPGRVTSEQPNHPIVKHRARRSTTTTRFYRADGLSARSGVLLRSNRRARPRQAFRQTAISRSSGPRCGQGRVVYSSLSHSTEAWDIRNLQICDARSDRSGRLQHRRARIAASDAWWRTGCRTGALIVGRDSQVRRCAPGFKSPAMAGHLQRALRLPSTRSPMNSWRNAGIVDADEASIRLRGYVTALMQRATFTDTLFLLHRGRLPSDGERAVLDDPGRCGRPWFRRPIVRRGAPCRFRQPTVAVSSCCGGHPRHGDEHGGAGLACMELIGAASHGPRVITSFEDVARQVVRGARPISEAAEPGSSHAPSRSAIS